MLETNPGETVVKLDFQEGRSIEFKAMVNDNAVKTVAAFANSDGGRIYIGVADDGEVLGIDELDKELLRLTEKMRTSIRPDVLMMVSVDVEQFDGKSVIVVTVQKGPKRPYYLTAKGLRPEGVCVRSGAASVPSSDTAILQMIHESEGDSFEARESLCQQLTFDYVAKKFADRGMALDEGAMRTMGLIGEAGFTNLALLLSDQCPSFLKAAAFDDDERNAFLEREEYTGSLLAQLDSAYEFLESHNKFKTRYDGLERVDFDDYPSTALREALVNAVAHREYALSGPTLVSVMPSRIEIVTLGGLVPGITFADLTANISVPRNKLLASVLYRLGIIEAWGTGIGRMRSAYEGWPAAVELSVTPNTFTVALANRNARRLGNVPVGELTRDEIAVARAIAEGETTRSALQEAAGFSQTKTINVLNDLIDKGIVVREGGTRNVRYLLK